MATNIAAIFALFKCAATSLFSWAFVAAFEGENYPIAEQLLFELGANAELLGVFLQGGKE